MKLKHLESHLSDILQFKNPKIVLEQYVTPPHIAACMLHYIQTEYEDISGKIVADLGCGAGALSIGSASLDASLVLGFEIDSHALDVFRENVNNYDLSNIDAVQCDVLSDLPERFYKTFDTVIMNPPFGTKNNAGTDLAFLKQASKLASCSVYSLHKTSTRKHVTQFAENLGGNVKVIAELKYNLINSYKFHKFKSVDIEVDLIRVDFL